ncbi:hypothetical protein [Streptomyces sp. NPDC048496]|uniref:hypothetical protein n=1 Tax=Streptomyces sp. NPDC048496 TaxID=3365558 RepID=UPI0037123F81
MGISWTALTVAADLVPQVMAYAALVPGVAVLAVLLFLSPLLTRTSSAVLGALPTAVAACRRWLEARPG